VDESVYVLTAQGFYGKEREKSIFYWALVLFIVTQCTIVLSAPIDRGKEKDSEKQSSHINGYQGKAYLVSYTQKRL
jgi:hypothetical protein